MPKTNFLVAGLVAFSMLHAAMADEVYCVVTDGPIINTPCGPYQCTYVACSDGTNSRSCGYLLDANNHFPSLPGIHSSPNRLQGVSMIANCVPIPTPTALQEVDRTIPAKAHQDRIGCTATEAGGAA